jgi:cell division protein FtsW
MGLVGTLFLVTLFLLFLVLGRRIAVCAPDLFGTLLAAGITFLIALQAGLNMGVATGLLPTKGLALPFISSGGSSLLVTMAMAGVLLNIGIQGVEPEAPRRRLAAAR